MTKTELITVLKSNLFSDRGTDLEAALEYAKNMALASENPIAVFTAIQVVLNTVANLIENDYEKVNGA
jgi:hypothetical protein